MAKSRPIQSHRIGGETADEKYDEQLSAISEIMHTLVDKQLKMDRTDEQIKALIAAQARTDEQIRSLLDRNGSKVKPKAKVKKTKKTDKKRSVK